MNIVLHLESKDTEFVGCASKRVKKRVLGELMPMIVKLSLSAGALQTGGPGGASTSGAQGAQQQRSPGLSLSVRPRKQGNMKLLLEPRGQQLTSHVLPIFILSVRVPKPCTFSLSRPPQRVDDAPQDAHPALPTQHTQTQVLIPTANTLMLSMPMPSQASSNYCLIWSS